MKFSSHPHTHIRPHCYNNFHWKQSNRKEHTMTTSLYERLGGTEGITRIANDIVENHLTNPRISKRFDNTDIPALKNAAATFFITGAGGPEVYQGKDMVAAHAGMNIDIGEFTAVLDDALAAMEKNNTGQREQEEVLFILYSMKPVVVGQ